MRLQPIKGEEWIEEMREHEFWIGQKRSYPQKFYSRLTRSYFGWWCYMHLHQHRLTRKAALLIEPLSIGGLWSHIHCFLFNTVITGWWGIKHKIWRVFHRQEWEYQLRFMRASMRAMDEGYADPMPPPPPFQNNQNFHGIMLGKRYFDRIGQLMKETSNENEDRPTA